MLIKEEKLAHWIDNFYGYGTWDSRVWFVAYEEDGGEVPGDVADRVDFFSSSNQISAPTLCDIREVYRAITYRSETSKTDLFPNRYEYRFGPGAGLSNVWKNLIAFEFGFRNEVAPDFLFYQRNILAAAEHGNEALVKLYPLPGPRSHAWYYAWLETPGIEFLKSRSLYEQALFNKRMEVILSNVEKYKPQLVLMYGMTNINSLKEKIVKWAGTGEFKMIKGTKLEVPQHHRIDLEGTIIVITTQFPALRHNRPETGFNWYDFGRRVAGSRHHHQIK